MTAEKTKQEKKQRTQDPSDAQWAHLRPLRWVSFTPRVR